MALWELSAFSRVSDAAMTTAETIPCEWPVAPESQLRSSPGVKLATTSRPNISVSVWTNASGATKGL